jgi:hypothetical protein
MEAADAAEETILAPSIGAGTVTRPQVDPKDVRSGS